jgi:hypothetical protein
MPYFILHHQHDPAECATAFAAWTGYDSPLRHRPAASTCLAGGHALWWRVEAADAGAALELLPRYVRRRTAVTRVRDVEIP